MFHIDHVALLYLVEKQALIGKLPRWMLSLQEFVSIIQHRPGTQHAIEDFLSKVDNGETVRKDDDVFPDVDVLWVAMMASREENNFLDRWLMEMTYFLTTGMPLPQLRIDEKKRLALHSRNFCRKVSDGILYHKVSDAGYGKMRRKPSCAKLSAVQ